MREVRRAPGIEAAAALAALAAPGGLGVAAALVGRPRGECWRVVFARPIHVGEPVLLHGVVTARSEGERHDVPLTAVLDATRMEGETTLRLAAAQPLQVEAFGLREASPGLSTQPRGGAAWRIFRYNSPAVGLSLRGLLRDADRVAEAAVDHAALTTYVHVDGALEHHFVFHVSHWRQQFLPLQLPPGARLLTYQVDGVWSPRLPVIDDSAARPVVNLPAPAKAPEAETSSGRQYEVVYATRAPLGWLWTRVEAPAPSTPVPPAAFTRTWRLAPEFSPINTDWLRRLPGPGEGTAADSDAYKPEDLFREPSAAPPLWTWFPGREEAVRQEALSDALLGLRDKTEQKRFLATVLVDTAAALRKMRQSFVVDATALKTEAVGPETVVIVKGQSAAEASPPWDDLGLTALRTSTGWLLTTRRQAEAWRQTGKAEAPSDEMGARSPGRRALRAAMLPGRFQAAAGLAGLSAKREKPAAVASEQLAAMDRMGTTWQRQGVRRLGFGPPSFF